jgi:hypothetical protein
MGDQNWPKHFARLGSREFRFDQVPEELRPIRSVVEPWLAAVLQSEHLSLLVGNGLTLGVAAELGVPGASMTGPQLDLELSQEVEARAATLASRAGRGEPNVEDLIRAVIQLIQGLEVLNDSRAAVWEAKLQQVLSTLRDEILNTEKGIRRGFEGSSPEGERAQAALGSFLLTFASRTATRERLHVFTTNYDRLIEHASDFLGLHVLSRFVGALEPKFRSSRLNVDIHYNPPGIRGEPRYLEGVVRYTKLHGSIDWVSDGRSLKRHALPFGAEPGHAGTPDTSLMVYPNSAKDIETSEFPYAELFRDLSAAVCRPNSTMVTYGYGFGDDHINRVIRDMLTIPSTHLVIISYDDPGGRVSRFCQSVARDAQVSLLIGGHFGAIGPLTAHYLPKPAIDLISWRRAQLVEKRGFGTEDGLDLDSERGEGGASDE